MQVLFDESKTFMEDNHIIYIQNVQLKHYGNYTCLDEYGVKLGEGLVEVIGICIITAILIFFKASLWEFAV